MDFDEKIRHKPRNKLRILCIHGFRQNGQTFKGKLGAFRSLVKKKAELVFVDAPLKVPPIQNSEETSEEQTESFGWWFSLPNNSFNAMEPSNICEGFDESMEIISAVANQQGPFDGLLGFSQGAAFVALLCLLQQQNRLTFNFKFAVIIAGFKSRCIQHQELFKEKISLPTLHVFGENDKVIPKEMSEELLDHFVTPVSVFHPGGHFLPVSSQQKSHYTTFLENCIK